MPVSIRVVIPQNKIPGLLARLRPQLAQVVSKAAHDVEARAKVSILTGPKTGRIYTRGLVSHQASAPGQAPANDLGVLAGGIGVVNGSDPLIKKVRSSASYSADLELGTIKMAPRPFLRPALEAVETPFVNAIAQVIDNG